MDEREERTRVSQVSRIADKRLRDGVACLVQIYGSQDIGKKHALSRIQTTIGRGQDSEIICHQDNVSRAHCRIYSSAVGDFIEDLGSTNGTFVNDVELQSRERLRNGDFIKIGGAIFKYISGDNIEQLYYEEIYRMAIYDGLTMIYNKRYFVEFLEREMARCGRYNRPLTLVLFDVDHFKKVNDNFGHLAGDHVLKQISDIISQGTIRKEECFARYGGEEFAICLPDTMVDRGGILAEKIRSLVQEEVFEFESNIIPVTISLGVSHFQKGETPEQFISRADAQLYRAKENGRNRVCVDDAAENSA
ncbi:MAG: GGDEF domain-containing protein [Myxococcales bacterium]|nr:GGDEF domain-containing protein [Myxococcales bacterium]